MARTPDFLSPEFIRTLREKCFSYVLATDRLYDAHGKRVDTKRLSSEIRSFALSTITEHFGWPRNLFRKMRRSAKSVAHR